MRTRTPLGALALVGLGLCLALRLLGGGAAARLGEPSLNLVRAGFVLASLALLGADAYLLRRAPTWPPAWALGAAGLWLGSGLIGWTVAIDPASARLAMAARLEDVALLLALFAVAGRGAEARRALLAVLLAASAAIGGIALKERLRDLPAARAAYERDPSVADIEEGMRADLESRLFAAQASGPFLLPNALGAFGGIALLASLGLAVGGAGVGARSLGATLAVLSGLAVVLSAQRGAYLAIPAGLALGGALRLRRGERPRAARALAAAFALAAIGLPLAISVIPRASLLRLPGGFSLAIRHDYAEAALGMVREAPLVGMGPGQFSARYGRFKPEGAEEVRLAHDDWLEAWAEGGPLGLLALAGLWGALIASARATREEEASREEAEGGPAWPWLAGGAALGAACLPLFGATIRSAPVSLSIALVLGPLAWGIARALSMARGGLLRAGALAGVGAFVLQAGIDFLHAEPGTSAAALLLATFAAAPRARPARAGALPGLALALGSLAAMGVVTATWLPAQLDRDAALAEARGALRAGRLEDATRALLRAHAALPDDPEPAVALADGLAGTGQPEALEAAARILADAIGDRPDLAGPKRRLGEVLAALGRHAEARAAHAAAVAAEPDHPGYRLAWARALARGGDEAAAAREAREALRLSGLQVQVRRRLSSDERRDAEGLAGGGTGP